MDPLYFNVLDYVTIQLYAYIVTRKIFERMNRRRLMRRERRNREFTDLENFTSLIVSFIIAGSIFSGISGLFPDIAALNAPIWLADLVLIGIGFFIARALGLLENPYA
ncbi:MAG: hypothetical protein KGH58_00225 [Candidatus Micrarchaeota archaeon]|nr:hypothetical protein [Candidatus Micrarchaeota archaeon]